MIRPMTAADIPQLQQYLATVPYPPLIPAEQWEAILAKADNILLVDTTRLTAIWIAVEPVAQQANIIFWGPQAAWTEDNFSQLVYVLRAGLEAVTARYPGSGAWSAFGDLQGRGATKTARRINSRSIGNFIRTSISPAITVTASPQNDSLTRIALPVSAAIAALVPLTP